MANTSFENAVRYLDADMVRPMRMSAFARQLFNKITRLPAGKKSIDYDTITEIGNGYVAYNIPFDDLQMDMIKLTPAILRLPNIYKPYAIERSTIEAYASAGKDILNEGMLAAMYAYLKAEEAMLMQSWKPDATNAVINGLYASAGNDYSTSKDVATDGNLTDAVLGGLALNDADGVPPLNYNLTLNPTQFRELQANKGTTSDFDEFKNILNILNPISGPAGRILMDAVGNIAAGTGLLSPVDTAGAFFDLVVAEEPRNLIANEKWPNQSSFQAVVFSRMAPRIKQANSLCKLSAI